MNKNQRILLIGAGSVFLLMLMFPPFHGIWKGSTLNYGYAFIMNPPAQVATVDVGMLLMQFIAVGIAAAIGYLLLKEKTGGDA